MLREPRVSPKRRVLSGPTVLILSTNVTKLRTLPKWPAYLTYNNETVREFPERLAGWYRQRNGAAGVDGEGAAAEKQHRAQEAEGVAPF